MLCCRIDSEVRCGVWLALNCEGDVEVGCNLIHRYIEC